MSKVKGLFKNLHRSNRKGLGWLIDPEKEFAFQETPKFDFSLLDLVLIGGSTPNPVQTQGLIQFLRKNFPKTPICLFPGSYMQITPDADALLFLSLISGRNPEYLIGQQVKAAQEVSSAGLEVLPTGYLLVNEGEILSVHSLSQTLPLLNSQIELIQQTALAGKLLGMKYFYLDAGSGAKKPIQPEVIRAVKKVVQRPILVGGGLDSLAKVRNAWDAGADLVVIGNQTEKDPGFLAEVLHFKQIYNHSLNIN